MQAIDITNRYKMSEQSTMPTSNRGGRPTTAVNKRFVGCNVNLLPWMVEAIDEICKREGVTRSFLVRSWVAPHLLKKGTRK
jgi:hypothetical protein